MMERLVYIFQFDNTTDVYQSTLSLIQDPFRSSARRDQLIN